MHTRLRRTIFAAFLALTFCVAALPMRADANSRSSLYNNTNAWIWVTLYAGRAQDSKILGAFCVGPKANADRTFGGEAYSVLYEFTKGPDCRHPLLHKAAYPQTRYGGTSSSHFTMQHSDKLGYYVN